MDIETPPETWITALTEQGARLALQIKKHLEGSRCFLPERLDYMDASAEYFKKFQEIAEKAFSNKKNLVCVMAAGIVVRTIAPLMQGKDVDPAVVVMDEKGKFVISLLSGHLGGANELAVRVAAITGGTPVITTATDVNDLPAIDLWAKKRGLAIENLSAIREINLAFLEKRVVGLIDLDGRFAPELKILKGARINEVNIDRVYQWKGPGIYIGCETLTPGAGWLILRPRSLVLGIGCNRGTTALEILEFIHGTMKAHHLSPKCIGLMATIDAKKDETGLIRAANELGVEIKWFTVEELRKITVPNPSETVIHHMGTPSVCEAAAIKAAGSGKLLLPKKKSPNVTLAVAKASYM